MNLLAVPQVHWLSGVDLIPDGGRPGSDGDHGQMCRVLLDGVVYEFSEDPEDGYRSAAMEDVELWAQGGDHAVRNLFPPVAVTIQSIQGTFTGIRFTVIESGELVLEIGTDESESYYPSFVSAFHSDAIGPVRVTQVDDGVPPDDGGEAH